jgi:hypothetical protein
LTSIPWSQIGAKAGADDQGEGLAVIPAAEGARLRCVFQRLEGEAASEGLWVTSTAPREGWGLLLGQFTRCDGATARRVELVVHNFPRDFGESDQMPPKQ